MLYGCASFKPSSPEQLDKQARTLNQGTETVEYERWFTPQKHHTNSQTFEDFLQRGRNLNINFQCKKADMYIWNDTSKPEHTNTWKGHEETCHTQTLKRHSTAEKTKQQHRDSCPMSNIRQDTGTHSHCQ